MSDDGGEVKLDPICELFRMGDPEYRSITSAARVWIPSICTMIGLGGAAIVNITHKRPTFAGIQRFGIWGLGGLLIGLWLEKLKHNVLAEKDIQYYHYMTLHPEDFKAPERVQYKDYLGPWTPVR